MPGGYRGRVDIIGADLVALYPEHYARVAVNELGRTMPVCPVCGTGDCVHHPTEDEMSARRQRTEDKSAQPLVTEDKVAPEPPKPDVFEGTYDVIDNGRVRFTKEVVLVVPAPGGATTKVLVAPVGMVKPAGWLDQQRAYYGIV